MIHTIENDYLRVSVDDHGAELCSIFDKIHNREVIWQADPAYWKRRISFQSAWICQRQRIYLRGYDC